MRTFPSQPVWRTAKLAVLALLLSGLPGCQVISNSAPAANVRIIDASPDAGALDIYQGGGAVAYNLGFGTVTSYVRLSTGASTISASTTGTRQELVNSRGSLAAGAQYTVLIGNLAANLQGSILTDQSQPAPAGQVSLRILGQASRYPAGVDVYLIPAGSTLATATPLVTNVLFGSNSGYVNIPAGAYTIALLPAGTVPAASTIASYIGTKVVYPAGAARTILLLDGTALASPALQVVIAADYDPPTG